MTTNPVFMMKVVTVFIFLAIHCLTALGMDACKIAIKQNEMRCANLTSFYFPAEHFLTYDEDHIGLSDDLVRLEIIQSNFTILQNSSFKRLPHLQQVLLPANNIKTIEAHAFLNLNRLKWLDLSYNNIESLHVDTFAWCPIKHLSLQENVGFKLPTNGPLLNAKKLTWLNLKGCGIEHLSGTAFQKMRALTHLDLSHNQMSMMSTEILKPLKNLQYLDLSNNLFTTLDIQVFASQPVTDYLKLGGNPWSCDCALAKLIQWYSFSRKRRQHSPVYCANPPHYANELWASMRPLLNVCEV